MRVRCGILSFFPSGPQQLSPHTKRDWTRSSLRREWSEYESLVRALICKLWAPLRKVKPDSKSPCIGIRRAADLLHVLEDALGVAIDALPDRIPDEQIVRLGRSQRRVRVMKFLEVAKGG